MATKVSGSVAKQTPPPTKAASGSSSTSPTKPIRKISGPSINPGHVGPKNAPYQAKDAK